jgi:glucokinase
MTERSEGRWPVLALDIGGTKLAAAVVTVDGSAHGLLVETDAPGRRLARGHRATVRHGSARREAGRRRRHHGRRHRLRRPARRGVGAAAVPAAPARLVDVPIGPLAAEEFGVPFALQNDATAAALAEYGSAPAAVPGPCCT